MLFLEFSPLLSSTIDSDSSTWRAPFIYLSVFAISISSSCPLKIEAPWDSLPEWAHCPRVLACHFTGLKLPHLSLQLSFHPGLQVQLPTSRGNSTWILIVPETKFVWEKNICLLLPWNPHLNERVPHQFWHARTIFEASCLLLSHVNECKCYGLSLGMFLLCPLLSTSISSDLTLTSFLFPFAKILQNPHISFLSSACFFSNLSSTP